MIGVAQLCNKIGGIGFSTFDEEIAQAFSIYCCISIMHVSILVMLIIYYIALHFCSLCGMKPRHQIPHVLVYNTFIVGSHCFVCWIMFHHQEIKSAAMEEKVIIIERQSQAWETDVDGLMSSINVQICFVFFVFFFLYWFFFVKRVKHKVKLFLQWAVSKCCQGQFRSGLKLLHFFIHIN